MLRFFVGVYEKKANNKEKHPQIYIFSTSVVWSEK